ncbi:MAG: hypothetical protein H5T70_00540, partial [Chloroflexi bacterium]|nr:hypothetical protein [Chloroflexota bacterium]
LANGRVWGDIEVGSLLIDEGGMFRGRCTMAGEDIEALAAAPQAAPASVEAESSSREAESQDAPSVA